MNFYRILSVFLFRKHFTFLMLVLVVSFLANEFAYSQTEKEKHKTDNSILFPIVYFTPETSIATGGVYIQNLDKIRPGKTSNIRSFLSITAKGQSLVSTNPTIYLFDGKAELTGNLLYSYFPDKYFGRGLNNLSEAEKFTQNTMTSFIGGGWNFWSDLYLRGGLGYDKYILLTWQENGVMNQEVQSIGHKYEAVSSRISFEWDNRDYPQAPRDGSHHKLTAFFYHPHNLEGIVNLNSFEKYELDLRHYLSFADNNILALQLFNSTITGRTIPFQYLNSIGGGSRLRGFYAGRYRDKAIRMLQAEVRHEWNDKWVTTLFASAARLGESQSALDNENESKFFATFGGGVNYFIDRENRTKLRVDIGLGAKELGFYFLIGEAF